ncbi:1521_t:CDS:2, partial [Gigaspora margarita]
MLKFKSKVEKSEVLLKEKDLEKIQKFYLKFNAINLNNFQHRSGLNELNLR